MRRVLKKNGVPTVCIKIIRDMHYSETSIQIVCRKTEDFTVKVFSRGAGVMSVFVFADDGDERTAGVPDEAPGRMMWF